MTDIRFDVDKHAFVLSGGERVPISRDDAVVARLEAVRGVSLADLEAAFTDYEDRDGATVNLIAFADVPADKFDPDFSPHEEVAFDFLGGRVSVSVVADQSTPASDVERLLQPAVARHDAETDGSYVDNGLRITTYRLKGTGGVVGDLVSCGRELQELVNAADGNGDLTARAARDLIAAGRLDTLLGQPETAWLDAKGAPHALNSEPEKWEFAKDVAAFANTGADALIVYGAVTISQHGRDVLTSTRPFELKSFDVVAAEAILRDRITPTLPNLEVRLVEARAGYGYGWVFIPAQPAHRRPAIVTGTLIGLTVSGTHLSIPERVGEHTAHWDAATVFGVIQAGRIALQQAGGQPPRPDQGPPPSSGFGDE